MEIWLHKFIENLKINKPADGIVPFDLYTYQKRILNEIDNRQFSLIWKARQMGISSLEMAYALYHMVSNDNANVLLLSPTMDMSKNLLKKFKLMCSYCGECHLSTDTGRHHIELKNGSRIKINSVNQPTAKYLSNNEYTLIIIDEAAFMKRTGRVIETVTDHANASDTKVIISSTKKEDNDDFMEFFKDALRLRNAFNPIAVDWEVHPDRDNKWMKKQRNIMGDDAFEREYEMIMK